MRRFIRYLRTIVVMIVVSGLMLFPVTVAASGPVIYEQSPGHFGGFLSDAATIIVADEFQFDKPTQVLNITWWGGYGSEGALPLTDSFKIALFADGGGHPGTLLQVFAVGNNAMRTPTGDWVNPPAPEFSGRPEYQYYYDFPTPFFAAGGTRYWLAIVNEPSSDSWAWEVSGSLRYLGVQRSYEGGPWAPYYDNTAFRLKGTTVP